MLKQSVSDFEIEVHQSEKKKTFVGSRYEFLSAHNGIRLNSLHGILGTTGCLAGDTRVRVNRNGNGRIYTLKELCIKFGEYPGRENEKSFQKIKQNRIRSFIEHESRIGLRHFSKVIYSGIKPIYKLTLKNGKSVKATKDHEIMTKRGMVQLGSLRTDDMVMYDKNVRPSKTKTSKKKADYFLTVGKYHPFAKAINTTRDGKKIRIEKHRAIYEAHINGLSLSEYQEATRYPNDLVFVNPSEFDIHHIDFDHYNNDPSNLIMMERSEHRRLHAQAHGKNNFSQGKIHFSGIRSIEYIGKDEVFDVQNVYGTENFTANDIVVHNCGKSTLMKCIAAEAAIQRKILVWLSEETIKEYQELINYLDRSVLCNILWVEEKEIDEQFKESQQDFFEYFEQMVEESGAEIVIIDNVTTSAFYNQRFGITGQNRAAEYLRDFPKRKGVAVFYVAHTQSNISDNYGKVINAEDIRGSKELPLNTEYLYIIQKFTQNDKQYNVLRVAKYRHHEEAAGWYALKYEGRAYIGDSKVPFSLVNKIFKSRDFFGRKEPAKKKENS